MKMNEATILIATTLLEKSSITPQELNQLTQIPLIQIYRVISNLSNDGLVTVEEIEDTKHYKVKDADGLKKISEVVVDSTTLDTNPQSQEKKKVEPKSEPKSESEPVATTGRQTGKYLFRKVAYSKSQCAFQVVSAYVQEKNPTLAELKEVFPDEIVSRFGVVAKLAKAKELSGDRARYHLGDNYILKTADSQRIVCTNQWSTSRFLEFISAAAKVGMKIKPE